jgi:arylsulfatase
MSRAPNVLLVTVDSLRADAVYGSAVDTPVCDDLAADGVTYDAAFSQGPFTTFSMPSLFTSRYPSGLEYVTFSDQTVGVYIDEEPTLPEVLRRNGYQTAGFHSNPLLSNLFGFDRGFDTFDARLPFSNTDVLPGRAKILADKLFRLVRKHAYLPAEFINERALDWLDSRDSTQPFFLWLHYMDVHGPYQSKTGNTYLNKYRGERLWRKARNGELTTEEHDRLRALYREEVAYTDECLGDLLAGLRERDCFEDTLVVLTADHGEQFGEHGTYSHPHQLYDELIHVPLVVRDPHGTTGVVATPTELLDVFPSVCARLAVEPPQNLAGTPSPGFTDVPAVDEDTADNASDPPAIVSEANLTPDYTGCIRTARWKYIRDEAAEKLLFDLEADADEQENRLDEEPGRAADLEARLDAHLDSSRRAVGPERDVRRREISDTAVSDRLEDLGYLE